MLWLPSHPRLELVSFFKANIFVVMCNTVCTVCKKEKKMKKRHKSYFHCKHCDSLKSFSTVYLIDMLVPSSSNVAFVLRNFFIIFKYFFSTKKRHIFHYFFYFVVGFFRHLFLSHFWG